MNFWSRKFLPLSVLLLSMSAGQAFAGVVLSPNAVINNSLGEFNAGLGVNNLLDQSGLSAPYVSGVTDFTAYTGAGPTHAGNADPGGIPFASPSGVTSGIIDFDLGAVFNLSHFILWGDDTLGSGDGTPRNFSLAGALVSDFSSSTSLGGFTSAATTGAPIPGQVFSFAPTMARFVRFQISNVHGSPPNVNIGEVAFGDTTVATTVPEPGTLTVLGLGLAGLGVIRRRKRA